MLKKANRLSTNFEINVSRKYGAKVSGQNFHMFYLKAKNYEGPSKFTVVVSNKFDKSAVKRNKVKRLFREAVRINLDKIKPGYWVVIHPKFFSIEKNYEEINTDFVKTLQTLPLAK
ncbi:MAG TPA: ribonuclease P protein component [Candidatus Saccharimonadales bacterium]|nr:ribonuclease P protein component [Candidatus Saccharimonadales bacterium]